MSIQNNSQGLQRILEAVNNLPNASSGSTIQEDSGYCKVASDNSITVDCGFRPDIIEIQCGTYNGARSCLVGSYASSDVVDDESVQVTMSWVDGSYPLAYGYMYRTETGFGVAGFYWYSEDWNYKSAVGTEFTYYAAKYK